MILYVLNLCYLICYGHFPVVICSIKNLRDSSPTRSPYKITSISHNYRKITGIEGLGPQPLFTKANLFCYEYGPHGAERLCVLVSCVTSWFVILYYYVVLCDSCYLAQCLQPCLRRHSGTTTKPNHKSQIMRAHTYKQHKKYHNNKLLDATNATRQNYE